MAMTTSGRGLQASINVTPMIDVLLVLLIIFMTVAPVRPKGLETLIPQSANPSRPDPPESPVVLTIDRDGSYALNTERVDAVALSRQLNRIFAPRAQRVLFLKASGDLEFQSVATAIDIARNADITTLALMPRE